MSRKAQLIDGIPMMLEVLTHMANNIDENELAVWVNSLTESELEKVYGFIFGATISLQTLKSRTNSPVGSKAPPKQS